MLDRPADLERLLASEPQSTHLAADDLGLFFLVTLDEHGPVSLEAIPLKLEYCHTRLADGDEAAWIRRRFRLDCGLLGTEVSEQDGRLVVRYRSAAGRLAHAS